MICIAEINKHQARLLNYGDSWRRHVSAALVVVTNREGTGAYGS